MVDVGGHKLWMHRAGMGSPTVVFEAGLDDDGSKWSKVAPRISLESSTIVYSRVGLGRSSKPQTLPRTSQDMAADLHALLGALGTQKPIILVAHSIGALNSRVYAGTYPEDVAGIVLVDGSHPDQWTDSLAALPKEVKGEQGGIALYRRTMGSLFNDPSFNRENMDIAASASQASAYSTLGNLPLVVVTRSPTSRANPMLPSPTDAVIEDVWQHFQAGFLALSSDSSQVIARKAGHNIQVEEPGLVIDAILKVLAKVRALPRP